MSAPFTPEQEARVREIVREEVGRLNRKRAAQAAGAVSVDELERIYAGESGHCGKASR